MSFWYRLKRVIDIAVGMTRQYDSPTAGGPHARTLLANDEYRVLATKCSARLLAAHYLWSWSGNDRWQAILYIWGAEV